MSAICIRASAWEALTPAQRQGVAAAAHLPALGDPAEYVDGATLWRVHDDPRITEEQVAVVAALMENPDAIPGVSDA
jgi:hypothetical protein